MHTLLCSMDFFLSKSIFFRHKYYKYSDRHFFSLLSISRRCEIHWNWFQWFFFLSPKSIYWNSIELFIHIRFCCVLLPWDFNILYFNQSYISYLNVKLHGSCRLSFSLAFWLYCAESSWLLLVYYNSNEEVDRIHIFTTDIIIVILIWFYHESIFLYHTNSNISRYFYITRWSFQCVVCTVHKRNCFLLELVMVFVGFTKFKEMQTKTIIRSLMVMIIANTDHTNSNNQQFRTVHTAHIHIVVLLFVKIFVMHFGFL